MKKGRSNNVMAQMNDSCTAFFPPSSPIQRIIIIHINLYEICVETSLGENGSLEERTEKILYYHRDTLLADDEEWNLTHMSGSSTTTEEAVTFADLCTALYSLPASLDIPFRNDDGDDNNSGNNDDNNDDIIPNDDNDKTKSIYFGNSLLVFVPLESKDIVAVVQVSRLYQNGIKSDTGSASPLAIKASIERSHRLFCMLRGGGIVRRLEKSSLVRIDNRKHDLNANEKQETQCSYLGMGKLFDLMKNIRESKEKISRLVDASSDENVEEITQHINDIEKEVKLFRESLPIQSIRRDLAAHYNEYLSNFLEVCIRKGGAGRCLVEMMPIPIAQDSGSHTFQLSPSLIQPQCLKSLGLSMHQILYNHSSSPLNENDTDLLLGITIFHSCDHLLDNFGKIEISNDCASLLMAYMASYRTKMGHAAMSIPNKTSLSSSTSLEKKPGLLKRLTLSLGPMVDEPVLGEWEDTDLPNQSIQNDMQQRGRFIPSPPNFMLGTSDQVCSFFYGDKLTKNIWAPRISLPLNLSQNCSQDKRDKGLDDFLDAHIVVFEFRQFSFLIFLSSSSLEKLSAITLLIMRLEEELSEAVIHTFYDEALSSNNELNHSNPPTKYTNSEATTEPGQDVIFFERSKQKLILLLDPSKHPSSRRDKEKRSSAHRNDEGQARRFLGLGPKTKDKTLSQSHPFNHGFTILEWSFLGLDCRHLLASRLPLDVCLAFDDMMHEVTTRKDAQLRAVSLSTSDNGVQDEDADFSRSVVELCTCMSYGWIYAFATLDKDIYVFFDSSIYVTFADVQSAALRIKQRFFVIR
mmetsp:Transcript_107/g.139  ORF Transcript_107/g.139 Transcript_107/m.139 type:complete len:804 (-) Transcript_107:17-2428(-)